VKSAVVHRDLKPDNVPVEETSGDLVERRDVDRPDRRRRMLEILARIVDSANTPDDG